MKHNSVEKMKKTQGRRKIEIKKIENTISRQVTFSKRRKGLFAKASELCALTGAEVGIIVQSLGGKAVFSFGHPNIKSVISHYLTRVSSQETPRISDDLLRHKQAYDKMSTTLQVEKKRNATIDGEEVNNGINLWWNERIDELGFEELDRYAAALEELKKEVMIRAEELMLSECSSTAVPFTDLISGAAYGDFFLHCTGDQCFNSLYVHP